MPVLSRFGSQKFVGEDEMTFVDVETVEFPESIEMDVSYNSYLFASNGTYLSSSHSMVVNPVPPVDEPGTSKYREA